MVESIQQAMRKASNSIRNFGLVMYRVVFFPKGPKKMRKNSRPSHLKPLEARQSDYIDEKNGCPSVFIMWL